MLEMNKLKALMRDTADSSKVVELLSTYERASGQKVNKGKSSIFFSSNVIDYNKQNVCQVLQMREASANSTYLGLPNIMGKNKSAILGYLRDKACS